jgi:hypothetical protein
LSRECNDGQMLTEKPVGSAGRRCFYLGTATELDWFLEEVQRLTDESAVVY